MAERRTLTLDDIFTLEQVKEAQISPDGTQIAFVVSHDFSEVGFKTPASSIWLVPFDGSVAPYRLTVGSHSDNHPRWHPNGKTLAFLSDRDKPDVFEIYSLSLAGGESVRLTNTRGGVTAFKWSPGGERVAYRGPDAPDEAEEARIKNRDDAEHLDHNYKFTRLWVVNYPVVGEPKSITPPQYQVHDFAWYGAGWAVMSGPSPLLNDMQGWTLLDIQEGQAARKITQLKYATSGLSGTPDGKSLAWIDNGGNAEGSANELWVMDWGGSPKCVTSDYAGGIYWASWLPGGEDLLVIAVDSLRTKLAKVSATSGEISEIQLPRYIAEVNSWTFRATFSENGQRLALILEDGSHPAEVWGFDFAGGASQLTFFEDALKEVQLGRTETIRWNAPDGLEIEGILIYPANYVEGERYPLVADIHGGPTWYWLDRFMASWHDWGQWLSANGYAVLLPNPRGSAGKGREFAWRNRQQWGIGDFDDVLSGVDAVIERGIADPDRLGIGGWSYGGFMTAWAIGHTNRFKAAVVGAGVTNLLSFQATDISKWLPNQQMLTLPYIEPEIYLRSSPITYIANVTTPTLILHGACDERVRLGQGRELYHGLQLLNKQVEMVVYPREPHAISELHHQRDLLQRMLGWFDRFLKSDEPN